MTPAGIKCQYCGALLIEQVPCEGCGRKLTAHITQCMYCGTKRTVAPRDKQAGDAVAARQPLADEELRAQLQRGMAMLDAQRFADAEQVILRLEQLAPHEARVARLRGLYHQTRNEPALALQAFAHATKLAPNDEHAWVSLAAFLNLLQRYPDAVVAASTAIRCRPTFDEAYMIRGEALRGMRELDEARESFVRATELRPRSAINWFRLGELELDRGQRALALAAYFRALAYLPEEDPSRRGGIGQAIRERLADHPDPQLQTMVALLVRLADAGQPYPPQLVQHLDAFVGDDEAPRAPSPPVNPFAATVAAPASVAAPPPAPAAESPRTSTIIRGTAGSYRVHRLLGRGGFAEVYLVTDENLGDPMALKIMATDDDAARALFRREAELWLALGAHPNIVRVHRVDEKHGRLLVGMEYVAPNDEGVHSLAGLLARRGKLALADALRLAIGICHGLEHAYANGIGVHRDLKPENVLLGDGLRPKVADFGLAIAKETRDATSCAGTPTYMAPEQWRPGALDERVDVYALGVVLFELVTGRLPFVPSQTERHRMLQELRALHERAPVPTTGTAVDPIVTRCLQKLAAQRYPTVRALRAELHALYKQTTGEILPPPDPGVLAIEELFNRGVSLESIGKLAEAIATLETVVRRSPTYGAAGVALARCLASAGRIQDAEARIALAMRLDPLAPAAWVTVGNIKQQKGELQIALAAYERAIELAPNNAIAHRNRGALLFRLGRGDDAIAALQHGLTIDPSSSAGWTNLGLVFHRLGRYRDAIAPLRRAADLDRDNAQALSLYAECLSRTQQLTEALTIFDRVIALEPDSADGYSNKGLVVAHLGRYTEALALFDRATALAPHHPMILSNRGHTLLQLGRYAEARADLEAALRLDGNFVLALRNLARLHLVERRFVEAAQHAERALAIDGNDVATLRTAAEALHRLGRYDDARRVYEAATARSRDPALTAALARCLRGQPLD